MSGEEGKIYPIENQYHDIVDQLRIDLTILCKRAGVYEDERPTLMHRLEGMVNYLVNELPAEKYL
jgi:hypothetical protein